MGRRPSAQPPIASTPAVVADYETTLAALARVIRKHRPTCPPRETARQLLEYDCPGHTALVGVDADASRAVLHHERDGYVIAVTLDADGLGDGGPVLAEFGFGANVYGWVRRMAGYWGWVHPRYR